MAHANQTTPTRGRYVGPAAARIAVRIPQRVRFERGWFHTAALCHDSLDDRLSFRQRPDGGAIDVRCHSVGCSRERIIRRLERATDESIWSAYTTRPRQAAAEPPAEPQPGTSSHSWRLAVLPLLALLIAAPLALGYDLQVVALNAVGLGWGDWLIRRLLLDRALAAARGRRRR